MIIPLLILHGFVTVAMIGIILLQKSDDSGPLGIGGGGGNNALFTARGVANILTRSTTILAVLFIGNCILINRLTNSDLKKAQDLFVEDTQQEGSKAQEEKAAKKKTEEEKRKIEKEKVAKKVKDEKRESPEKVNPEKEAGQENTESSGDKSTTTEAKPETGAIEDTQPSLDRAKAVETSKTQEESVVQ